ncbi:MAG: DUF2283 domain-containing protein [Mesorhizobium sp.]|nr:DUF2283 domain-containing protein [Mesorhizobium sp.]
MKLTYDPSANVAYIKLREKSGDVETIKVSDDVLIDLSPDGSVFGIELLNANHQLMQGDGGRFVFVDPVSGEETTLKVA